MKTQIPTVIGFIGTALTWELAGHLASLGVALITIIYLCGAIRAKHLEIQERLHHLKKQEAEADKIESSKL